jgi:serine/threonine protein phosphatase PrpC
MNEALDPTIKPTVETSKGAPAANAPLKPLTQTQPRDIYVVAIQGQLHIVRPNAQVPGATTQTAEVLGQFVAGKWVDVQQQNQVVDLPQGWREAEGSAIKEKEFVLAHPVSPDEPAGQMDLYKVLILNVGTASSGEMELTYVPQAKWNKATAQWEKYTQGALTMGINTLANHLESDPSSLEPAQQSAAAPAADEVAFRIVQGTDPSKKNLEDTHLILEINGSRIYLAVDGMGGHAAGEIAAEIIRATFEAGFRSHAFTAQSTAEEVQAAVEKWAAASRAEIIRRSNADLALHGMGAVLVGAIILPDQRAFRFNRGDARLYLQLEDNTVRQESPDHGFVQGLLDMKLITDEQALKHRDRNAAGKVINSKEIDESELSFAPIDLSKVKALLLVSDGHSDVMANLAKKYDGVPAYEAVLQGLPANYTAEQAAEALLAKVKDNDSKGDDITLIYVKPLKVAPVNSPKLSDTQPVAAVAQVASMTVNVWHPEGALHRLIDRQTFARVQRGLRSSIVSAVASVPEQEALKSEYEQFFARESQKKDSPLSAYAGYAFSVEFLNGDEVQDSKLRNRLPTRDHPGRMDVDTKAKKITLRVYDGMDADTQRVVADHEIGHLPAHKQLAGLYHFVESLPLGLPFLLLWIPRMAEEIFVLRSHKWVARARSLGIETITLRSVRDAQRAPLSLNVITDETVNVLIAAMTPRGLVALKQNVKAAMAAREAQEKAKLDLEKRRDSLVNLAA